MILAFQPAPFPLTATLVNSLVMFACVGVAVFVGGRPFLSLIREREYVYDKVLRGQLLLSIRPRTMTVLSGIGIVAMAAIFYGITESLMGAALGAAIGIFLPGLVLRVLRHRRLNKLEDQLVGGIQTITSGVRAGLNLVQSMELVAKDGPIPLRQEFAHMLREYEYGIPLEESMSNAAARIGSGDFRLLFSALQTHRERGGDLGETLDRIAESIREIQRLENRVKALTAQGRVQATWLGAAPAVVLGILYFIDAENVKNLFVDDLGKLILAGIVVLNIIGFVWIKKIVSIDI